jgi:hypothetical protein
MSGPAGISLIVKAGAAVFVNEKLAVADTPATLAVTEYAPAVLLALNVRAVATPDALVAVVYDASPLAKVPLAPLPGAVNVTEALATTLPPASFTSDCNKPVNAVPTIALWPDPPAAEMLAAVPADTVSAKVFDVTPLKAAVMLVCPADWAVAMPLALTLATAGALDDQVTWLVRLAVELSLYVPVAVNCSLAPEAMEPLFAPMLIEESTMPVPVSATVCVLPGTFPLLSTMATCALLCDPCDAGAKATSTVHDAPAARVAGEIGQG